VTKKLRSCRLRGTTIGCNTFAEAADITGCTRQINGGTIKAG
jgi:predicted chitinase